MESAAPGDRFPTGAPCGSACLHLHDDRAARRYLAVEPYTFVFRAPAKGRWLDRSLLTVCVEEFAYVAPPPHRGSAGKADAVDTPITTTLDHRVCLPAYVEELSAGLLWLHSREAECRAAGESYRLALQELHAGRSGKGADRTAEADWEAVKQWCRELPTQEEADVILREHLPRLLPLRQRDVVMHRVWRQEGRMFAGEPLHILRCDLSQREANRSGGGTAAFQPALLVLNKPAGLPVHPSGRYRKNSCTSILEDVFGGCDGHLYTATEEFLPLSADERARSCGQRTLCRASIVHREHGFPLLTVTVRPPPASLQGRHGDGVSAEDWALMKQLLLSSQGASPPLAAAAHRSGDAPARMALPPLKTFVVHRLDAATSGVLLFGLDSATARETATLISQKDDEAEGGSGCSEAACVKTYLATLQGRLDTAAMAQQRDKLPHGCAVVRGGGHDGQPRWLRVDRPIGCLSFHQSLYWTPGPRRTEAWRALQHQQQQKSQSATTATTAHSAPTGRARGVKDAAAVAEKNERMRQLSRCGRGVVAAKRTRDDSGGSGGDDEGGGDNNKCSSSSSRDAEAAFTSTLRAASTLVQTVSYAAERDETVVACRLLTGRTHQLRVHLAALGHPIVGDAKYIALRRTLSLSRNRNGLDGCPPAEAEEEDEDEQNDDVAAFYRAAPQHSVAAEPHAGGACLCPERIGLHAWRYKLRYPSQRGGDDALEVVAPPFDPRMREEAAKLEMGPLVRGSD